MLFTWTRWLAKNKSQARKPYRRPASFRPQVEHLETRLVPATLSVLEQNSAPPQMVPRPTGGLIADSSGDLFGTNSWGGAYGAGTVFELANSAGSYTLNTLYFFDGIDGAAPGGPLLADSNGDLFGTTSGTSDLHGANNGTVFELVNNGGSYTLNTLASFNGSSGIGPYRGA